MTIVRASAPGKVVLAGEYAVLDGAPAVAMAVDRRAVVALDQAANTSLQSQGPGGATDTRLLDCVCDTLGLCAPQGRLVMDTRAFVDADTGTKLGIGSSAALAVALVRVFAPRDADVDTLQQLALVAHRRFQDGRGSGVDVATSARGGLVCYRADGATQRLDWPDGLYARFLWSGVAASTTARLDRLDASRERASRRALGAAAERLADLWGRGAADALIADYRGYVSTLKEFDVDHDLGIFDAGHGGLCEKALSADVVYKPCGAGGGDVGVVLGTDEAAVDAFVGIAVGEGFGTLDMAIDEHGAVLDGTGR